MKNQVPADALTCASNSGNLLMWAYKDQFGNWLLQFQILGPAYVMSKKWKILASKDFDFTQAKTFPIIPGEDLIGTAVTSTGLMTSVFENLDLVTFKKSWETIKDSQGQVIKGFQTPRYYISWKSGTYPKTSFADQMLNCSFELP